MSSWAKSQGSGRRPQANPNGSAQPLRSFRRPTPYPGREDRAEEHKVDILESYKELDQQQLDYSGKMQYDAYQHQQNAKPEGCSPADKRKTLYQKFYRQVQEERRPADCVVLSVTNQCMDYPKSLGQCLQERGLSVEMFYLQAESGLTRALQDVRADGSPLCILVEQTNVALSSCTVIIFSESLKIHRNMPKDQALDFVMAEYRRGLVTERPTRDPTEMAARASELLDDFLEREKMERHVVPSDTRQLLSLLAEGVHLYAEELGTVIDYLRSRQDHLQASFAEGERGNMLPPGLGKPPPLLPTPPSSHPALLPTPSGPPPPTNPIAGGVVEHHPLPHSPPTPLMATPASYPKTKPPPLLSMHRAPGPSHGPPAPLGPTSPRGPPSSHGPYGPPVSRGPPHHHGAPYHPGSRGSRGAPPSLKSVHMGLAGGPRPIGPRR